MIKIIASTYEIQEELGAGGGGRVYLAYHKRLGKNVILKADKRKITTREDLLRREVDVLKNLSHPYIPQVYDYFVEDGTAYTVMEYIEGESLNKPLKRGERFTQPQVIKWAIQLLSALEYLHEPVHGNPPRGFIHGDIKPANLMKKPNGDICLIDFNIALALGEEYAVGASEGYSAPEFSSYSFSSSSSLSKDEDVTETANADDETTKTAVQNRVKIKPDVRSDIYSVGATLYHSLSGRRPAKNALDVVPLSAKEFSPEIVKIIMKAMNPDPALRFQSAAEMLNAFTQIRKQDSRYKKLRKQIVISRVVLLTAMIVGVITGFFGLKRIQTRSEWLNLTEEAKNLYETGDAEQALEVITRVYPDGKNILRPDSLPQSQEVLTDILGVYNLSDSFRVSKTVQLPSAPICLRISPDAATAVCIYDENLAVINLENADILATLSSEKSALSEAEYIDNDIFIYAGKDGVTAYSISQNKELWKGNPATAIAVSSDGSFTAAVYKENTYADIYDTMTGEKISQIDFNNRKQSVVTNDIFANPSNNILALNHDGSKLAVSFSDGSLSVFGTDENKEEENIEIFDSSSGYTHFEGGFYQQYFAFAATNGNANESVFAIIDTDTVEQTGGFQSEGYYITSVDDTGILVGVDNILVRIDPVSGEQTPVVDTTMNIESYGHNSSFTAIGNGGKIEIFDENANSICVFDRDVRCNFLEMEGNTALIGSSDSPILWITEYEDHSESEIAVYDETYVHDEARLSADGKTITYFRYDSFRVCDLEGQVIKEVSIPDAEQVYDQQFIRNGTESYLEITYNDGQVARYDAGTGELLETYAIDPPDPDLHEVFETKKIRIESPLHGTPKVYDKDTGEFIAELEEDAYLTYVTEIDDFIVAQYVTTDNQYYGYLMDQKCQKLAYLPDLCDVLSDGFLFDYHNGYIRKAKIYTLNELLEMARNNLEGKENKNEKV